MTPATLADLVTEEGFARLRTHPGFRGAVEIAAAQSVLHFQHLDPTHQRITKDIGRATICVVALTLHMVGGLSVQSLTAACVGSGVSSAGRVQQLVRRCQDAGAMTVEPGEGMWTRRPMRVGADLIRVLRERALIDLQAMLRLSPELCDAAEVARTEDGFVTYSLAVSMLASLRRDMFNFRSTPPIAFFLEREAGILVLFDLLGAQDPARRRLLEAAPISRYALSRRYGVSRAHINKLFAESGYIESVEQGGRVVFKPALSRAMERHFAAVFLLNHCAAQAVLSGWRFGQPEEAGEAG
jgi:hypothetical protein